MSNSLATISQYCQQLGKEISDISVPQVSSALDFASSAISKFCQRDFAKTTVTEWYNNQCSMGGAGYMSDIFGGTANNTYPAFNTYSGYGYAYSETLEPTRIFLKEYPVNRVYFCTPMVQVGQISYSGTGLASISCDATTFNLYYFDNSGIEQDVTITYATDNIVKLSDLASAIATYGFTMTVLKDIPISLLKPINSQEVGATIDIFGADTTANARAELLDERSIRVGVLASWYMTKYNYGYDLPVDNAGHTALTNTPTLPVDLSTVAIYVAADMMSFADGTDAGLGAVGTNLLKKEAIKDYSYEKWDNSTIDMIVSKYNTILSYYKRMSL